MDADETRIEYKGYIIEAAPHGLEEWTVNIYIEKHDGGGVTVRPFSCANTFSSKEEAIRHCFDFGRQIIDGKIEGCTVNDL